MSELCSAYFYLFKISTSKIAKTNKTQTKFNNGLHAEAKLNLGTKDDADAAATARTVSASIVSFTFSHESLYLADCLQESLD